MILRHCDTTGGIMDIDQSDPSEFFYLDLVYDDSHGQEWSK